MSPLSGLSWAPQLPHHFPSLLSQEEIVSFPQLYRFSQTPLPAWRAEVHQEYRHLHHHLPMPAMANALSRSALGSALWLWTCLYVEAQRGGEGYNPLTGKSPGARAEASSEGFSEHQSVDSGRLGACRGLKGRKIRLREYQYERRAYKT